MLIVRRILIAVVLLMALVACTSSSNATVKPKTQSDDPVRLSLVHIDSRPEYAEVRVDGEFIGTTPLNVRLPAGKHKIELTRFDFQPWERQLTVMPHNETKLTALLRKP